MSERLAQLQEFLKETPNDPFLKYALAMEYLKTDETQTGLEALQQLVISDPDYVGTYYHLGKLYEKLNRTDDAVKTYQSGIMIAQQKRNFHALSELKGALMLLTDDDDDDF